MSMMPLPTTKEELERKAVDVLSLLATRLTNGVIDKRTAWVTAQTVWTLTAGLVNDEISQLAAQLANENMAVGYRRHFIHSAGAKPAVVLVVSPGSAYALQQVDAATGARKVVRAKRFEPGEDDCVNQVVDALIRGGYVEI